MTRQSRRTPRTAADLVRREEGIALITVILVALVLSGLIVVALAFGNSADDSSVRDRNFNLALAVAEAGVQEAIAKVEGSQGLFTGTFQGGPPGGSYSTAVTKSGELFIIESTGTAGPERLRRRRKVRVELSPPKSFKYALWSNTSIELKNNDVVTGDVWANDSVLIEAGTDVDGTITAARSWIKLQNNAIARKDVWSGGFNSESPPWAIQLDNGAEVRTNAKAAVTNSQNNCQDEASDNYAVRMTGATVTSNVTTWGVQVGGTSGTSNTHTCTAAPLPQQFPQFSYSANNYDASTLHEFSSIAAFRTWFDANKTDFRGTIRVTEPSPSQINRINLTGAVVTGDVTIITNTPVFTNDVTDSGSVSAMFVLSSTYAPPTGSACTVNDDDSECAVHLKNNFQTTCKVASVIYANNGPVAVKNNAKMCGTIYADGILVKNNQTLSYDTRVERTIGFGQTTYTVSRWEERTA